MSQLTNYARLPKNRAKTEKTRQLAAHRQKHWQIQKKGYRDWEREDRKLPSIQLEQQALDENNRSLTLYNRSTIKCRDLSHCLDYNYISTISVFTNKFKIIVKTADLQRHMKLYMIENGWGWSQRLQLASQTDDVKKFRNS